MLYHISFLTVKISYINNGRMHISKKISRRLGRKFGFKECKDYVYNNIILNINYQIFLPTFNNFALTNFIMYNAACKNFTIIFVK